MSTDESSDQVEPVLDGLADTLRPPPEKRDKPKPIRRQARRMLQKFPQALSALIAGGQFKREKKGRAKVHYMSDFNRHTSKQKERNRRRNKLAKLSRRKNR